MKQVKITNEKVRGRLVWNKDHTKCGIKVGEDIKRFVSHPDWLNPNFPDIPYLATYNSKMELKFLSPYSGVYKARFVAFAAKKDEQPKPQVQEGKFGPQANFTAICRLLEPKFNGMNVSITYLDHEKVGKDENGNAVILGDSKGANLLIGLLDGGGIFDQNFKYSTNLLPAWQKALKEKKAKFSVLFEKGYITKVFGGDEFSETKEEAPEPEPENEFEEGTDDLSGFDSEEEAPF